MFKTFRRGDLLCTLCSKVPKNQNRLAHLCVAIVNHLGDSDESPITDNSPTQCFQWIFLVNSEFTSPQWASICNSYTPWYFKISSLSYSNYLRLPHGRLTLKNIAEQELTLENTAKPNWDMANATYVLVRGKIFLQ